MVQRTEEKASNASAGKKETVSWASKASQTAKDDKRDQPWKKAFPVADQGIVEEDFCNLKLDHDVQGNSMAA